MTDEDHDGFRHTAGGNQDVSRRARPSRPAGHVEAGLRSGNIYHPWPEEVNRKVTGAVADLHFAPTNTAAAALRAENVPADGIHVTSNLTDSGGVQEEASRSASPSS